MPAGQSNPYSDFDSIVNLQADTRFECRQIQSPGHAQIWSGAVEGEPRTREEQIEPC